MNARIAFYLGIFIFLVGLWAIFSLVSAGIYNPLASTDFYLGADAWSSDSQQLRFNARFPSSKRVSVNSDGNNLHAINSNNNEESNTNASVNIPRQEITQELLEAKLGKIEEYLYSPDTSSIAVVTSHWQKGFPWDFYDENLYIINSTTLTIQFAANRSQLLRLSPIIGFLFPFALEVQLMEVIALIALPVGLCILSVGFIRLGKRKIILLLLIPLLLFLYTGCAFSYRLGWASF